MRSRGKRELNSNLKAGRRPTKFHSGSRKILSLYDASPNPVSKTTTIDGVDYRLISLSLDFYDNEKLHSDLIDSNIIGQTNGTYKTRQERRLPRTALLSSFQICIAYIQRSDVKSLTLFKVADKGTGWGSWGNRL
ncbi:MAG: hypothetical protein K2X27_23000 [Candidatus Obscuribacterales bacterium]|nr:hypothetical protein [Candidatus Obscuribacterales bacterium]